MEVELLSGQRQKGESNNAVICCNDWLRLGIARSVPRLLAQYQKQTETIKNYVSPTDSAKTLGTWSSRYDWPSRASAYDVAIEGEKETERRAVFAEGLALDYERTRKLLRLADFLEDQIYERGVLLDKDGKPTDKPGPYHNVWVPDVKSIGGGEFAERVDIERFNGDILTQYRGVLDDIAKEVGGRVKKQQIDLDVDVSKLTDEELERLISAKS